MTGVAPATALRQTLVLMQPANKALPRATFTCRCSVRCWPGCSAGSEKLNDSAGLARPPARRAYQGCAGGGRGRRHCRGRERRVEREGW